MIKILLLICFCFCSVFSFAQPQNLYANFGVLWNDYTMTERGNVYAVKTQSPNTGIGQCLFNQAAGNWSAKWCGSTTDFSRNLNQKLDGAAYYYTSGSWDKNMEFTITTSSYYTFIIGKNATANNDMSIIETNYNPATIDSVNQVPVATNVFNNDDIVVSAVLGSVLSTGEYLYIRYTIDNWLTSSFIEMTQAASETYSGTIPSNIAGTTVKYYILSTVNNTPIQASIDFMTLNVLNNDNLNYEYLVGVADTTSPAASVLSPADDAADIVNITDLVITFDENIQKGTGNIIVKKTSDSSIVQTIDVTTADVTISNNVAAINISNLLFSTGYYVNIDSTVFKDMADNNYTGISNAVTWNFTTGASTDTVEWCNFQYPQTATNTAGNAYIVYAQVYEPGVTSGAGVGAGINAWIGYSLTDSDPSQWTDWIPAVYSGDIGNNDEYSLDIGSLLSVPGIYYVASRFQINSGPFTYGGFGGIWNGTTSVNAVFTVTAVDETAPLITVLSPADDAADIVNTTDLVITFDENIQKGTGNIIVKKTSDSSIVQTIDVTTADVTISNNVAAINISNLLFSTGYYVNIDSTVFKDMADNNYTGISNAVTWNFTTGASTDTVEWCNFQYPQTATNTAGNAYIVYAQVYEPGVTSGAGAGAGINAWIGYSLTDSDPSQWTDWIPAVYFVDNGNNDEYSLDIGSLLSVPGVYYVASRFQINSGPFTYGGFGGIWNGTTSVNAVFTVTAVDETAPLITVLSPADNAADIANTTDLVITFDENIQKGTGNIIVKKTSDSSIVQTIDVTTADVTISNNVAAINISNLLFSTGYYVNIDSTVFKDMADNNYTGISNAVTWNFTTGLSTEEADWCNLQWPGSGAISMGGAYIVYAQVYEANVTPGTGAGTGINAWIGYSTTNNDPALWSDWIQCTFNTDAGNNDEYEADLGSVLSSLGTYYYASRFQVGTGPFKYGGYNLTGGGFWDGTTNVSGILDITTGLSNISLYNRVRVFPNPANNLFTIEVLTNSPVVKTEIIDVLGNVVYYTTLQNSSGIKKQIDISNLSKGLYEIRISGNRLFITKKLSVK